MPSILNATTSSGLVTSADNSGLLQLATNNGTTAVTIDTSQNVGIGTASISGRLTVSANNLGDGIVILGNDNANTKLRLTNSGGGGESWQMQVGQPGASNSDFVIYSNTATAQRMRLDGSGNLAFNSGYGSVATAYGCRAWVNFNGTGTVAIRASGNVSSITDNGTGNYTINYSTAMPDANGMVLASVAPAYQVASATVTVYDSDQPSYYASASNARILTRNQGSASAMDVAGISVSVFR
jgi:hypothetical protein